MHSGSPPYWVSIYDWFSEETCNSLYKKNKKIKKQNIDIDIIDIIKKTTTVVDLVDDLEQIVTPGDDASALQPVAQSREIITGSGTILGVEDSFDVPDTFGGGQHTTASFSGSFEFKLVQTSDPNVYDVTVVSVETVTASMDLNGFETGVLRGTLNPMATNTGEYHADTGQISFLFSQILTSDDYPEYPFHTWSHYYGTCNDCLNNGSLTLAADSFFISPFE